MGTSRANRNGWKALEGAEGIPLAQLPRTEAAQETAERIRLSSEKEPWTLIIGPRSLNPPLLGALARLGELGAVRVLDGGNRFNAYILARAARGQPRVLERVTVSRAFTCYQVLSLLEGTAAPGEGDRIVILDLLNTFYDESVQPLERKRLLRACLVQLERLARKDAGEAPVAGAERRLASIITVHPPAVGSPAAVELLQMLEASPLVETFFVRLPPPPPAPLQLF